MVVIAVLVTLLLVLQLDIRRKIMAFSEEFIAFADEALPIVVQAGADIQELHDILDADVVNVEAARAKLEALRGAFAALQAKIDIPEPGDEVPPPGE